MEARSLSPTEARIVLSLEADGREDLSLLDLQRRAKVSPGFARRLAHSLVRKAWLQRVGRGRYLLSPARHGPEAIADADPFRLGSRIASPYYFGYATAAELLGLLPQASRVYYLVAPYRVTFQPDHASVYRPVRVAPGRFFGLQKIDRRGVRISVSDQERTVLDCLDRPEFCGGLGGAVRVLESAGRRLNWKRMEVYLNRLGNRSLELRLGYLSELLAPTVQIPSRTIRRIRARPDEPYVPLGAPKEFGRRGPYDLRWHVIRNLPEATLLAEVDLR